MLSALPPLTAHAEPPPRRSMSQMNVVPYIDVMLVLLVIFMVTTPMFSPGVVNLPSVGKAAQVESEPVQVLIDAQGNYSVSDKGSAHPVGRSGRAGQPAGNPHWRR